MCRCAIPNDDRYHNVIGICCYCSTVGCRVDVYHLSMPLISFRLKVASISKADNNWNMWESTTFLDVSMLEGWPLSCEIAIIHCHVYCKKMVQTHLKWFFDSTSFDIKIAISVDVNALLLDAIGNRVNSSTLMLCSMSAYPKLTSIKDFLEVVTARVNPGILMQSMSPLMKSMISLFWSSLRCGGCFNELMRWMTERVHRTSIPFFTIFERAGFLPDQEFECWK